MAERVARNSVSILLGATFMVLCAAPLLLRAADEPTTGAPPRGKYFQEIVDAEEKAGALALPPLPIYKAKNAPAVPKVEDLPRKKMLTQYGITWTFDKEVPAGQFISGDWYVVGEVTVVAIDPKPLFGDEVTEPPIDTKNKTVQESKWVSQRARHGAMVNPPALRLPAHLTAAGFDSRLPSGRYKPDLFAHLPIALKPNEALISTISRGNEELTTLASGWVDALRSCAVLTCLAEPQPADAFRPSYGDTANSKIYLARNLHRELLSNLPRLPGMPESLHKYARVFQRPWQQLCDYGISCAIENMPHYGQGINELEGEATLLLQMDYSPEQKERLVVNLAQVGIDLWGQVRLNYSWMADGAHHQGRKWPIVFAGLMLGDEQMQSPKKYYPKCRFEEDDQTAMCPYTYNGKTYERCWTGAKAFFVGHNPWDVEKGEGPTNVWELGWGPIELFHPKDWPLPGKPVLGSDGYRMSNASPAWVGLALAIRLMHQEKAWGHDAFFPYVDRWMTEDDTEQIKVLKEWGREDRTQKKFGDWNRQGYVSNRPKWVKEMWRKYRNSIPPGPNGEKTPPAETTWK